MYILTISAIWLFYNAYGIIAYLSWGPDVAVIVSLSLPQTFFPGTLVGL